MITEYIIGYIYPERPVANMCFKVYGYISMAQALSFVGDFKLGHYMKIPPRAMFMAQVNFLFCFGQFFHFLKLSQCFATYVGCGNSGFGDGIHCNRMVADGGDSSPM